MFKVQKICFNRKNIANNAKIEKLTEQINDSGEPDFKDFLIDLLKIEDFDNSNLKLKIQNCIQALKNDREFY